jgi:hypothetical protein
MGWNESAAYFCATTESVRDVEKAWLDQGTHKPSHPMKPFTLPIKPAQSQLLAGPAYQMSAVYVDNFLLAAVEDITGKFLQQTARVMLYAIHSVFQMPQTTGR